MTAKHQKITNPNYRQFLDKGEIELITATQIEQALNNIKGRYVEEGRALLCLLYLTGCRPVEALELKAKDITRENGHIKVHLTTAKRGRSRTVYLPSRLRLVKELYTYAVKLYPDMLMFGHFRGNYTRKKINSKGVTVEHSETSDKLRYHVLKWFKGVVPDSIPPYFLRHNRFSALAEAGVSFQELQQLKGAKDPNSIQAYLHLSSRSAKNLAKKIK